MTSLKVVSIQANPVDKNHQGCCYFLHHVVHQQACMQVIRCCTKEEAGREVKYLYYTTSYHIFGG